MTDAKPGGEVMPHVHSDPNSACDMSCIEEDQPTMTDAKGLSEVEIAVKREEQRKRIDDMWKTETCMEPYDELTASHAALAERLKASEELRAKGLLNRIEMEGAFYEERDQLKERLKACEREIQHIDEALARRPALADKPDRLHKILYTIGEAKRCDQLAADLKECEKQRDKYKGDAQTMRGFLNTHGCTPSTKAGECDQLKADLADVKAELARMKADPEILVRHQANEAQRALEAGQEKKGE